VSCELTVQSKSLTAECMSANSILKKYMKMENGQSICRPSDSYQDEVTKDYE